MTSSPVFSNIQPAAWFPGMIVAMRTRLGIWRAARKWDGVMPGDAIAKRLEQ
jgi:hypothetical protein